MPQETIFSFVMAGVEYTLRWDLGHPHPREHSHEMRVPREVVVFACKKVSVVSILKRMSYRWDLVFTVLYMICLRCLLFAE